jgi:hypothetical protein
MTSNNVLRVSAVLVLAIALFAGAAGAQPNNPVGLWNVVAHDDTNPFMPITGAQQVCFLANGTWFSPTYPGWGGVWFQKGFAGAPGLGNRLRLLGNWGGGPPFSDSAELDFIHLDLITGPWTEWRFAGFPPPPFPPPPPPPGPPFFFLKVTACRIGQCNGPIPVGPGGPPPLTIFGAGPMPCNP